MFQVDAIEDPFRQPEIVGPTLGVLKRADAMGLFTKPIRTLNVATFREVIQSLRKAGIAPDAATFVTTSWATPKDVDRGQLLRWMKVLTNALEESPVPSHEWRAVTSLFQPELELLAELLSISVSSLRRYSAKHRNTPDDVAARLHFIALITADLTGAYNDIGVRSWFRRKRALLDGKAPKELLRGNWQPGDPGPEHVRALARSLAAGSAT